MVKLTADKFLNDMEFATLSYNLTKWADSSRAGHLDKRNALIFLLLLHTGTLPFEILNLRVGDVFDRTIFVKGLHGSASRTVPLPPELYLKLKLYIDYHQLDSEILIFPLTRTHLWEIWDHWRPSKKSLRSLRHTFALRLFRKSRDIKLVQRTLGYRSPRHTEVYLYADA